MSEELWVHINNLIEELVPSALVQKHRKKALTSFAEYYFSTFPAVSHEQALILLFGDGKYKGIVQSIGRKSQIGDTVKVSSIMAVELLGRLLDPDANKHAFVFQEALSDVDPFVLREMKLERHVLTDSSKYSGLKSIVFIVIASILSALPHIDLSVFVESPAARQMYYEWTENQDVSDEDLNDGNSLIGGSKHPMVWEDVDEETLNEEYYNYDVVEQNIDGKDDEISHFIQEDGRIADPLGVAQIDKIKLKRRGSMPQTTLKPSVFAQSLLLSSGNFNINSSLGSANPLSESFDPHAFLLQAHAETSFKDLVNGLRNIKASGDKRQKQMRNLVKLHFDQFINSKNTIDSIHSLLGAEVSAGEKSSRTAMLERKISLLLSTANSIYKPMLERKNEADRIRKVLGVLKRFDFLFAMPGTLMHNIRHKHYDQVVRDYQRISKLKEAEMSLVQQVITRIMYIIDQFRNDLKGILLLPQASLADQERTIAYLIDLDCEDPAMYFLENQFNWMCKHLDDSFARHSKREEHPELSYPDELSVAEKGMFTSVSFSPKSEKRSSEAMSEISETLFLKEMVNVFKQRLPNFWKVAWDVVNEKYSSKNRVDSAGQRIKEMMSDLFKLFSRYVKSVLLYDSTEEQYDVVIPPNLGDNTVQVLTCYQFLEELDIPIGYLKEIRCLVDECSDSYILLILRRLLQDITAFASLSYEHVSDLVDLPTKLKNLFDGARKNVKRVRLLSYDPDRSLGSLVIPYMLESFRAFADVLHWISFEGANECVGRNLMEEDRYMLCVMQICQICRNEYIPLLWKSVQDNAPQPFLEAMGPELSSCLVLFSGLEDLVLDTYCRRKVFSGCELIRQGIFMNGSWDKLNRMENVREYFYVLLLDLASIQHEASSACPDRAPLILEIICERLIACFKRCVDSMDTIDVTSAILLSAEVEILNKMMRIHLSQDASAGVMKIRIVLEQLLDPKAKGLLLASHNLTLETRDDIVDRATQSSDNFLRCFL